MDKNEFIKKWLNYLMCPKEREKELTFDLNSVIESERNEAVEDERNRCADLLEEAWKTGNTTWEELFESIKEGEK